MNGSIAMAVQPVAVQEGPVDFSGDWVGNVFGTNTGNIYVQLNQEANGGVLGEARFLDDRFGVQVFTVEGTADQTLRVTLTPIKAAEAVEVTPTHVSLELGVDGGLRGRWIAEGGTGGMVTLHRFFKPAAQTNASSQPVDANAPAQVVNVERPVGAVRMTKDDVRRLISVVIRDFNKGRAVVTYAPKGRDARTMFADAFIAADLNEELRALTIGIHEQEPNGINRGVTVELVSDGENLLRVYGSDETWVRGRAELVAAELEKVHRTLVTTYKKYGLDANLFIFLVAIAFLPDAGPWVRFWYLIGVLVILGILKQVHSKLIPLTLIQLGPVRPSVWTNLQSVFSWSIAIAGAIAVKFLSELLSNSPAFRSLLDWLFSSNG